MVRTEVNGALPPSEEGGPMRYVTIQSLHEYNPHISGALDWRTKLDSQKVCPRVFLLGGSVGRECVRRRRDPMGSEGWNNRSKRI